jgi:pimeloyl-ACP methyl ester carboxylesterase
VVETFFRATLGAGDEEIARFRAQPSWAGRVGAAGTVLRESRAGQLALDAEVAATVTVPVLLLIGSESARVFHDDARAVADALPDARIVVLDGQRHVADAVAPELVAGHLLAFLRQRP